jgi:hypothetical protein
MKFVFVAKHRTLARSCRRPSRRRQAQNVSFGPGDGHGSIRNMQPAAGRFIHPTAVPRKPSCATAIVSA